MTGYINVMLVLQSCTDPLHIPPSSSSDTYGTSSDCAYHSGNMKVEGDLDMQQEEGEEVNVKTEKGRCGEEEECIGIEDEEGMYSEEEVEEKDRDIKEEEDVDVKVEDVDVKEEDVDVKEEDVDIKEEVSLEDTL